MVHPHRLTHDVLIEATCLAGHVSPLGLRIHTYIRWNRQGRSIPFRRSADKRQRTFFHEDQQIQITSAPHLHEHLFKILGRQFIWHLSIDRLRELFYRNRMETVLDFTTEGTRGTLMNALRIRTHVESDTLHFPDLQQMIGKNVEIIVLVESSNPRILKRPRTPGSAKGMITMADDFTAPLPFEIVAEFYA